MSSWRRKKPRCLLIGLDGGRADLLRKAMSEGHAVNLNRIDGLQIVCSSCKMDSCARTHSGAHTPADSMGPFMWKTSPGWNSMGCGVDNHKHRVHNNTEESIRMAWTMHHMYPPSFAILKEKGFRTALVARPSVLGDQAEIGIFDHVDATYKQSTSVHMGPDGDDANTAFVTNTVLHDPKIDFVFLHLNTLDQTGHAFGWDSSNYQRAIRHIDRNVGKLLREVHKRETKYNEDWLVIVTADHGGRGMGHGTNPVYDTCIPLIFSHRVYSKTDRRWSQLDVAPTVLTWFGVDVPDWMDGVAADVIPAGMKAP